MTSENTQDTPDLPDPGPPRPDNYGLIFYVPEYWLVSHQQHYISCETLELAEAIRDADHTGNTFTQYEGSLTVTYLAFDEDNKPYVARMYWKLYKAVTAGPDSFDFFIWGEDEDHVRMQLANVNTAVIDDRTGSL